MPDILPEFTEYGKLSPTLELLTRQFSRGEVAHSYLLTGPRGIGKMTLAMYLTASLYCTSPNKPCGCCEACRQTFDGNNPDVMIKTGADGKTVKVDEMRDVLHAVSRYTFGNSWRVVLIEPMEALTPQSQNALLKSLEEPLPGVVFILMAHELGAALGTIASRCLRVKLPTWPDAVLSDTLIRKGYAADAVSGVLPLSSGNIGVALNQLSTAKQTLTLQELVSKVLGMNGDPDAVSVTNELKEDKDLAGDFLDTLEKSVNRVVLARTGLIDSSTLKGYPARWQDAAQNAPIPQLNSLISAIVLARKRRLSQVNWQANLDTLLQAFLEAYRKWQK